MSSVRIVEPGIATTVQDLGRRGQAHLGIPRSGAVDVGLMAFVNRLVGNPADATVIETCGNLVVRAGGELLVADSVESAPRHLHPGSVHRLSAGAGRTWRYLAVRGGFDVPLLLGSSSTDTLSGLCAAEVLAGTELAVGREPFGQVLVDHAPLPPLRGSARISIGPRLDWFAPGAFDTVTAATWTVTESSRIGVRLTGAMLHRSVTGELPSEGLVRGAIQMPPDGNPVMMLADHPTTGGYPVIAVVHPDDVATVAQHRPGSSLRLTALPRARRG
jgi:biotin-dependent carboxylase-like uncharacterized protein